MAMGQQHVQQCIEVARQRQRQKRKRSLGSTATDMKRQLCRAVHNPFRGLPFCTSQSLRAGGATAVYATTHHREIHEIVRRGRDLHLIAMVDGDEVLFAQRAEACDDPLRSGTCCDRHDLCPGRM